MAWKSIFDERTMIFAIASHTQAPSFDRGKAEPDGFAQGGSVDVRDPILIANSSVREIQSLTGNIAIRVGSIVGRQPVTDSDLIGTMRVSKQLTRPERKSVLPGLMRS
jgi:hypothetical protein